MAALSLLGITKDFPGVRALDNVTFETTPGKIHALVGENGAGKSTLMAIAACVLAPDSGEIKIFGESLAGATPKQARKMGLGIVRQDPALLPDLTVAENIALGVGIAEVGGLSNAVKFSDLILKDWNVGIDSRAAISDLTQEQRFIVEISKALAVKPKILVLDEPTEHLSTGNVEKLFGIIREFVNPETSVIYISHRIREVKMISDEITILRDGKVRGTYNSDQISEDQIIEYVIGRTLETVFPPKLDYKFIAEKEEKFTVTNLHGDGFANITFSVRSGEIVGIAGVQGNGQEELIQALSGLTKSKGEIEISGNRASLGNSAAMAKSGLIYLPADRHAGGVLLPIAVGENVVARTLRDVSVGGIFINKRKLEKSAQEQVEALSIKTPSLETPLSSLSGGNQQKVVLSRAVLSAPKVILAEEPTQGVDAGARVDIYKILREAADNGAAVVIFSTNGVELEGLCDRILIMSRGNVVEELAGEEVSEEAIARAALTSTAVRERVERLEHRQSKLHRWLRGDQSPAVILFTIAILLGLVVSLKDSSFFSAFNLNAIMFSTAPLIFMGIAQLTVVLGSGFDLSVGPLSGVLVVIASFFVVAKGNPILGFALLGGFALTAGLLNATAIVKLKVNPVVMTLATFMLFQGLYLFWRPTPGGAFPDHVTGFIAHSIGSVPIIFVIACALALLAEFASRRTRFGLELRATGSRRDSAEKLGIKVNRITFISYVLSSLLTIPTALVLISLIGIGDGRPGLAYTLQSITVVVLAGASIFGGRGSYIGLIVSGFLLQQVLATTPFLGLPEDWTYWVSGGITIIAATIFAQLRSTRSR